MIDMNNFLSFQIHGAAGHGGGGVAGGLEQLLAFIESLIGLSGIEMFAALMPGVAAMANMHPLVVHFPIAFLMTFLVVDLVGSIFANQSWRQLAGGLLYLGTIGAAVAVGVGLMAEGTIEHGENVHLIMERHKYFGISVFCLSAFLSLWRLLSGGIISGAANAFFLFFAVILNILLLLGADLGGLMVYKHGVAVEAVAHTMTDYFHEHTHTH